jgi:uncharacterized membrane protein YedE/YeeE
MNWRAIGCLTAIFGGFLLVGLLGLAVAFRGQTGCPGSVAWADRVYRADGTAAPSPRFDQPGAAANIGSTFFGLTTRTVYGPPGSSPSTAAADRPSTISIDCGDGTFQTYDWDGVTRTPRPSDAGG